MNAAPLNVDILAGKLTQVLRSAPDDVRALCEIGAGFFKASQPEQARKCYRAAVDALKRAAHVGDADRALEYENLIYLNFVRVTEDEEHYYRCFADWKDDLVALGLRFRQPAAQPESPPQRVGFFMHTGFNLRHTQVLLRLLASRPDRGVAGAGPVIYVFEKHDPALVRHAHNMGVQVVVIPEAMKRPDATRVQKLLWLRERIKADRVGVLVWVTLPTVASLALSMRLAPVQIFWAMRFHPLSGPHIDGYITGGGADETSRRYGKQDWQVVPLMLAIDDAPVSQQEVQGLRSRFPEKVLLGTLAREEKINSAPFLQAVSDVLTAHPEAGFLWTGRNEHPAIADFFRRTGVAERCHFVGWVDTRLHAAALDVFLDTFPHGCGITSYQAFAARTPLLSYLGPLTIFGTRFWKLAGGGADPACDATQPRLNAPDEHAILCARDTGEYLALAGRLITDAGWRAHVGARGRSFFESELGRNTDYSRRFFDTVSGIVAAKPLRFPS